MRLKTASILLTIILIASLSAWAQDEGDGSRGSFLITRPSASPNNTAKTDVKKSGADKGSSASTKPASLGLGYTLYKKDSSGKAVRVNPAQEFKSGDALRITLEPNASGYLYVFHTENNGEPTMLYPDARLNNGKNIIKAHVPREIPSSSDPDPSQRWFVFDDKPAVERIYIVISRQPLPDLPVGEKLLALCKTNPNSCPVRPSEAIWSKVKTASAAPVIASKSKTEGQAQSDIEKDSIGRGLGLPKDAPSPSVINMSSSASDLLVTAIDLKHK